MWPRRNKIALPKFWLATDDSHRFIQAKEIARHLSDQALILSAGEVERAGGLSAYFKQQLSIQTPAWPEWAIGAGEATASLLLAIKQVSNDKTKIAICLDPKQHHNAFDAIILPEYEAIAIDSANVLCTVGLINPVNPDYLKTALQDYTAGLYPLLSEANLPSPRYAVLVGGDYVGGKISPEMMQDLGGQLVQMLAQTGGSLMISTSPRTPQATADALRKAISSVPYVFYDYPRDRNQTNPYAAMLGLADGIIATGDSVRMCSEACSTGKEVRIVIPDSDFHPYAALHQQLFKKGYALPFSVECEQRKNRPAALNEAKRIADILAKI